MRSAGFSNQAEGCLENREEVQFRASLFGRETCFCRTDWLAQQLAPTRAHSSVGRAEAF